MPTLTSSVLAAASLSSHPSLSSCAILSCPDPNHDCNPNPNLLTQAETCSSIQKEETRSIRGMSACFVLAAVHKLAGAVYQLVLAVYQLAPGCQEMQVEQMRGASNICTDSASRYSYKHVFLCWQTAVCLDCVCKRGMYHVWGEGFMVQSPNPKHSLSRPS